MIGVIRSEVLRAVSGSSILPVYLVALLMPAFVLFSDGSRIDVSGLDDAAATAGLLEPLAWSGVAAAFVGAYGVTRECYYGSIDRTLTGVGIPRAFAAKLVAGVLVAIGLAAAICALWTVFAAALLDAQGLGLRVGPDVWPVYIGALVGAALGALIGGAIAWMTRNYYVTAAIVLLFPLVVEFALLRTAPEIAKFSPGLALAAVSIPQYQDRLLDLAPAVGVAAAWALVLVAAAWVRERRRSV